MEAYCLGFTMREEAAQVGECSGISRTPFFSRVKRGHLLHSFIELWRGLNEIIDETYQPGDPSVLALVINWVPFGG